MADQLTLQIQRSFLSVHAAIEAASAWLAERKAPAEIQYFANLAIEEFATNTIKYGYDDASEHVIEVALLLSGAELVLTILDDGHPFNPLEAPEPELGAPLEERPTGGLGIYLVRQMADRMEYVREGGKNRLTLRKAAGRPTGD